MDRLRWSRPLNVVFLLLAASSLLPQKIDGSSHSRVTRSNSEIDNFIYDLKYSNDKVLAYTGESKENVVLNEGKFDANRNFVVVTREKKTLQNGKTDIGVVASNEHQTFPGSLLLANQRLIDNTPDVMGIERANLTYTVNLPGLTHGDASFTVVPSFSEYQSSVNHVLKTWFEKYPKDHDVVSNFQREHCFANSQQLLRVKFGLEFKTTNIESSIDFSAMEKQEKLTMIYRFKQIFYTVSVEPTKKPSDLFDPKVTLSQLQQKTNENNPPVIVDSVSYGRTIYVKVETTSTDKEAKAILDTKLTNFDVSSSNEVEFKKHLNDLNMQVYVLGGSSEHIDLVNAKTFKEVNDVIVKWSKFTRTNLGYPISYSTQFIKDNSRAVVNMATEYIDTTRTIHKKGIIKIVHKGWFIMQWAVTWEEFNYDSKGNKVETSKSWWRNWQDLTSPFDEEIELPGNAEDIKVFARLATGIAWNWWSTVIDRSGIPLIDKREFTVWGTTFDPYQSISPGL